MEVVVVTIIVSIIAAIAVPSMIGFVRHGQQVNRMNVARTLYLSMQNQLTRAITEGNLRALLTEEFYVTDANGNDVLITDPADGPVGDHLFNDALDGFLVEPLLGAGFPDPANARYVYFINKPADFTPGDRPGGMTDLEGSLIDRFFGLLDEIIINKEILDAAILMEFNIRTGVVMSIFYGDGFGNQTAAAFGYGEPVRFDNVAGARGMGDDGYWPLAQDRRQGYYGILDTGFVQLPQLDDIVRIFDGMNYDDLTGGGAGLNIGFGVRRTNILFAEFLLTDPLVAGDTRDLILYNDSTGDELVTINSGTPGFDYAMNIRSSFSEALTFSATNLIPGHAVYRDDITVVNIIEHGVLVPATDLYNRYIWVIDYVEGNLISSLTHNNVSGIKSAYSGLVNPADLRARVSDNGININSFMTAHSHYAARWSGGEFEIKSVRHLNNIRHDPIGQTNGFVQSVDIDISTLMPVDGLPDDTYNFRPINPEGGFNGTYNATLGTSEQRRIFNLRIVDNPADSANAITDVGLFGVVNGGDLIGISLIATGSEAVIDARSSVNTGSIAGRLTGPAAGNTGTISRSNSFINVTGGTNTGGIVGHIEANGILSHSFNAGFFDTRVSPARAFGTGTVITYSNGTAGGLAGLNAGLIQNSYNNARVNIGSVSVSDIEPYRYSSVPVNYPDTLPAAATLRLGGIAGQNTGTINNTYATNYVGIYAENDYVTTEGIAGGGTITNSFYLANGNLENPTGTNAGNRLISKANLSGDPFTTASFRPNPDYVAAYNSGELAERPKNIYERYPYPILEINRPFAAIAEDAPEPAIWGWEDIDEVVIKPVVLVYYEIYDNGTESGLFGFGPSLTLPSGNSGNLRNDLPVREAGYVLVVESTLPTPPVGLQFHVRPATPTGTWSQIPIELVDTTPAMTGFTGSFYFSEVDLNSLVLSHETYSANLNVPLYYAAAYGPMPGSVPEAEGRIHPYYANALDGSSTSFEIRTPWQMQNISKSVSGDLGGLEPIPGQAFAEYGGNASGNTPPGMTLTCCPHIDDCRVATKVQRIQNAAQVAGASTPTVAPGSVITGLGGGRILIGGVEHSVERLSVTAANVTFEGDFTGISTINVTGAGSVFRNFRAGNSSIYVAQATTVNVAQGIHLSNVNFASRGVITVTGNPGANPVFMDALFYTTSTITVNITGASAWSRVAIPQFISQGAATVTMTSTNYISGIFFTHATGGNAIRIDNITAPTFHGVLLTTGNINPQGWPIDNRNIVVPDNLDPHIRGFLVSGNGWRERAGTKPPDRSLTFRQTRDIDFGLLPDGDIGNPVRYGGDGTTAIVQVVRKPITERPLLPYVSPPANAVVTEAFNAVYQGLGHTVRDLVINTTDQFAGLFAANNGGLIRNLTLADSSITGREITGSIAGGNTLGGLAGNTDAIIENCVVRNTTVTGTVSVGGITGGNTGTLRLNIVEDVHVTGTSNVGGVTGSNSGPIYRTAVQYSTVRGTLPDNHSIGGIAGANADIGRITDVYFLSLARLTDDRPVSDNGGGIVGQNNGPFNAVLRALYLAPAPRDNAGIIYPIVRTGTSVASGSGSDGAKNFYLQGHRYSVENGADGTWNNRNPEDFYNITDGMTDELSGGGAGLTTTFMTLEWLNFYYEAGLLDTGPVEQRIWHQPSAGYPYPMLRTLTTPTLWPETNTPVRPEQVDRTDWTEVLPTAGRAGNVGFINGDWSMPLMNPLDTGVTLPIYPGTGTELGWQSQSPPQLGEYNQYDGFFGYYDYRWVQGWNTRPNEGYESDPLWNAIEFMRPNSGGTYGRARTNYLGTGDGIYAELNANVPGTLFQIAPTTPESEFFYSFFHTRRNLGGAWSGSGVAGVQRMDFYLSGMINNGGVWEYDDSNPINSSTGMREPTIIRPCITPRNNAALGATTALNAYTRRSVVYGTTQGNTAETVTPAQVEFYDPVLGGVRNAWLYDVWVAPTTGTARPIVSGAPGVTGAAGVTGFGITFWSDTQFSIGTAAGTIPLEGVRDITTARTGSSDYLPAGLLAAARDNVIGYWDVARFTSGPNNTFVSEWKQYYGLYKIPAGQTATEFAFQSRSAIGNADEGNFLDGMSFASPGFLSIDKYINLVNINDSGTETSVTRNVSFVQPRDTLRFELVLRNWGEVPVSNIVVFDRIDPFDAYLELRNAGGNVGNVRATGPGGNITIPSGNITLDDTGDNYRLAITLPPGVTLAMNEEITVTFDVVVRPEVAGHDLISTMLYYFRNQGEVLYYNSTGRYQGYSIINNNPGKRAENINRNASGLPPAQAFIDPIRLYKTISNGNGSGSIIGDNAFTVTLQVRNTLPVTADEVTTMGIITETIPAGFVISGRDGLGSSYDITVNDDGTQRINIRNVNINASNRNAQYTYTLQYVGISGESGYGVLATSRTSEYRYSYSQANTPDQNMPLMLRFPQQFVGIRVKTADDVFDNADIGKDHTYDILTNDHLNRMYADGNYDVMPEIALVTAGGERVGRNANGEYQISSFSPSVSSEPQDLVYIITLRTGTNQLSFEPGPKCPTGPITVYYKVFLTATRPGSAEFELDSRTTSVTINAVSTNDMLVYYERYDDGTYGYFSANGVPRLMGLNHRAHEEVEVLETGYGVLSTKSSRSISLSGSDPIYSPPAAKRLGGENTRYLYKLGTSVLSLRDLSLADVEFDENVLGSIHPSFAKAIYPAGKSSLNSSDTVFVRAPWQHGTIITIPFVGDLNWSDTLFARAPWQRGTITTIPFAGDLNWSETFNTAESRRVTIEFERGMNEDTNFEPDPAFTIFNLLHLLLAWFFGLFNLEFCELCENSIDVCECYCDLCDELHENCECYCELCDELHDDCECDKPECTCENEEDCECAKEECTCGDEENCDCEKDSTGGNNECTCEDEEDCECEAGSTDGAIICDCGECEDCLKDGEPDEGGELDEIADGEQGDKTDSDDKSNENIDTIAAGAITLVGGFGGFGLTRSQRFKELMKRSNARAIRRINEYNSKKRANK
jgi:uncharacterized repeat protein (TIGR01451 family)